jgi:uncharacterized membrane protein YccC
MLQLVIAGLVALFVASIATSSEWDKTFGGATTAGVAEFERAKDEYFAEAERRNLTEISLGTYLLEPDVFGRADEQEKGTYELRQRLIELVRDMGYSNRNKALAAFRFDARLHNSRVQHGTSRVSDEEMREALSADGDPWVMCSIAAGIWIAVKAAAIAFVVAWLLMKLCELLWWFLLDRLHDVANAVRRR